MRRKGVFWIVIDLESLILRTCKRKALSERDSWVCILEMRAEAMHGSINAVGIKYYLAVRRSCSWSGRRLQCLWTHVAKIKNPIRKRIVIRNRFRNVIRSPLWTGPMHRCTDLLKFCHSCPTAAVLVTFVNIKSFKRLHEKKIPNV